MRVIGRDAIHIARPRTPQHHCHFSLSQEEQSEEEESTAAGPSRTGIGPRLGPRLQRPIGMGEGTAPTQEEKATIGQSPLNAPTSNAPSPESQQAESSTCLDTGVHPTPQDTTSHTGKGKSQHQSGFDSKQMSREKPSPQAHECTHPTVGQGQGRTTSYKLQATSPPDRISQLSPGLLLGLRREGKARQGSETGGSPGRWRREAPGGLEPLITSWLGIM